MRSRKTWVTGSTSLRAENEARTISGPRRQVESRHDVAAIGQSHEVGPGATGDVDDPADRMAREPLEAVDEEVDLALAVEVEGDLVKPRRAVLPGAALLA